MALRLEITRRCHQAKIAICRHTPLVVPIVQFAHGDFQHAESENQFCFPGCSRHTTYNEKSVSKLSTPFNGQT